MPLGLTMEEIQLMIAEAAETTPDIGPDGNEMSDPEYVTAYLLNIIIPLLRYNNMRIEEQLRAVGIVVPDIAPAPPPDAGGAAPNGTDAETFSAEPSQQ